MGDVQAPKIKTRKGDFLVANKTNDLAQNLSHRVHKIDVQVPHSVHTWIIVKKVDKENKESRKINSA